jgi:predicted ATPase/class 3 adenylate cyclase
VRAWAHHGVVTAEPTLPTGTVTFVFTDIEGSTRLVQRLGDGYDEVLAAHHAILRETLAGANGSEVRTAGDSFFVAFSSAADAVAGVVAAQRRLQEYSWPDGATVRVRIGMHTGEGPLVADDYGGVDVNRAARIAAAGHGGQVILSAATSRLVDQHLPPGVTLRDLGDHSLRDLSEPEHIYQLVIPGLDNEFPPLESLDPVIGNLPAQLTSFIGRERELAELTGVLSSNARLVTLTGPGGTGKTRLAIELGAAVRARFDDGVFFVSLAAERDPALISGAIARALELREIGGQSVDELLIGYLGNRRLLLLLDNFEHLLESGPTVAQLLRAAPSLRLIVTSRVPLRVAGEQQYLIEPLELAEAQSTNAAEIGRAESVQLFVVRARAASPAFELHEENARTVADLCARLDGLPLAIELAAARSRNLPPAAILSRIDQRLDSLIAGGIDLPARQRTLRATIEWSHDLLAGPERKLFARVAVFAGGARLDDVEAVCGPPSDLGGHVAVLVAALADHSLLRSVGDSEPRFQMLETIREFALERLTENGEERMIRGRHADRFADLARQAERELMGSASGEWVQRLEQDHDNVSAALDHVMASGPADLAVRMPSMLWRSWQMSGRLAEGHRRTTQALELEAGQIDDTARRELLEAAGGIAYWQGDFAEATAHYEAALALARKDGHAHLVAGALYNLAFAQSLGFQVGGLVSEGWARAVAMLEECARIYQDVGDRAGRAKAQWGLSEAAMTSGDLARAALLIDECLAVFRELRDEFHTGWVLRSLALLQRERGEIPNAIISAYEGLRLFHARNDVTGVLFFLSILARLSLDVGEVERGLRLAGATRSLQISSGADLVGASYSFAGSAWDDELERLGPDAGRIWAAGARMTMDDAVSYALRAE